VAGLIAGRPHVECRFVWKLGQEMTPNWPVTRGYLVEIEGDPDVTVTIGPPAGHFDGAVTTAMPCVNAIPMVCAAAPGLLNQGELPLVHGSLFARSGA
jgi:hypothetical protein